MDLKSLEAEIQKLKEVIDANAKMTYFMSLAVNTICKKIGVSKDEVLKFAEEELAKDFDRFLATNGNPDQSDSGTDGQSPVFERASD